MSMYRQMRVYYHIDFDITLKVVEGKPTELCKPLK